MTLGYLLLDTSGNICSARHYIGRISSSGSHLADSRDLVPYIPVE